MNNLTTRKIVLGLLMALVLAFSVQGTADALTLTKSSGDLVTVSRNQTFTIKFSIDPDSRQEVKTGTTEASATDIEYAIDDRTRPGPSNDQVNHTITTDVGYSAGDTHYYTVTTTATRSKLLLLMLISPSPLIPEIGGLRARPTIIMMRLLRFLLIRCLAMLLIQRLEEVALSFRSGRLLIHRCRRDTKLVIGNFRQGLGQVRSL